MTKEEKELLLKDLCARLPYGVKINREWIAPMTGSLEHFTTEFDTSDIEIIKTSIELGEEGNCSDGKMNGLTNCDDGETHFVREYMCKPYLRLLSSITEEEKKEFLKLADGDDDDFEDIINYPNVFGLTVSIETFDWLNSHRFDYRGLIPMGLALEAPEGMYNIN